MNQQTSVTLDFSETLRKELEALPSSSRFTAEQLEVIYALAYAHMQQKQWEQALPILAFLCQYGPTKRHYLLGLALCLRMLGLHEEAINTWSMVLVMFPDYLEASLYIAQCQLAMNDPAEAKKTLRLLDMALEEGDPVKIRTRALLEQLETVSKEEQP